MMYQRIKGLLIGCAYGDAMGMPSEMMTRETMKKAFPNGIHSFMPSSRYDFIGRNLEAGKVTDDTINTLLVWKSIVENHGIFNVDVYLSLLHQWISVHQEIAHLIMGPSTLKALNLIEKGIPLSETGKFGTTNGACMKVSGIGVINDYRELHKLIKEVEKLCLPTHNSTIAIMGASVIAAIVSYVIRGGKDIEAIWDIAYQAIEMSKKYGNPLPSPSLKSRMDWVKQCLMRNSDTDCSLKEIENFLGCGMETIETVPTVMAVLTLSQLEPRKCAQLCANLSGDTDTIGAIATGISGAVQFTFQSNEIALLKKVNHIDFDSYAEQLCQFVTDIT